MQELPVNQVMCADSRELLKEFPDNSIDLTVTSPPYWGLRDYGGKSQVWGGDNDCEHIWGEKIIKNQTGGNNEKRQLRKGSENFQAYSSSSDFCINCGAWRGQFGLEPHPQMFVDHLVEICREIKRVIKPSGSFWLNLGDTYYGSGKGAGGDLDKSKEVYMMDKSSVPKQNLRSNWLQPKQKLMIPERTAIALQDDGWVLRNSVIWYKPNHMPESVRDRLTKSYEYFFFFVKSKKYYFNLDKIRDPHIYDDLRDRFSEKTRNAPWGVDGKGLLIGKNKQHPNSKNPGDMWSINTQPFPGSHFAVFPDELVEKIIKCSSPKKGIVLDPFAGSGTTLRVARRLGRKFIGIELNPEYAEMCEQRVRADNYTPPPENVPKLSSFSKCKRNEP